MYFLTIFMFFLSSPEASASKYEVNFSKEQWSVQLLLDTCKEELQEAIDMAMEEFGDERDNFVAVLPEVIGYQYFKVTFMRIEGQIVFPYEVQTLEYEFDYGTEDDMHEKCTGVNPRRFIY